MARRAEQRTDKLLEMLQDANVDFVVVGGVAAISHGATTMTRDLDILIEASVDNLRRLFTALTPLHPVNAARPDLDMTRWTVDDLAHWRMILIETDLGRLDILTHVEPIGTIDDVDVIELELLEGRSFRVLTLDQLIEVKESLGRPKDRIVAQELRKLRSLLRPQDP